MEYSIYFVLVLSQSIVVVLDILYITCARVYAYPSGSTTSNQKALPEPNNSLTPSKKKKDSYNITPFNIL
jgi:hypothetical protein